MSAAPSDTGFELKQWDTETASVKMDPSFTYGINTTLIPALNACLRNLGLFQFLTDGRFNFVAFKTLIQYLHQNGYDTSNVNLAIQNLINRQAQAGRAPQSRVSPPAGVLKTGPEFKEQVERMYRQIPVTVPEDLQKDRWGGLAAKDGISMTASVKKGRGKSVFNLIINIEVDTAFFNAGPGVAPLQVPTEVAIFLHNSFEEEIQYEPIVKNKAQFKFQAYQAASIGAFANNGTALELDLNQVEGFPNEFYYQDAPTAFKNEVRDLYTSSVSKEEIDIQKNRWEGKSIREGKQLTARFIKELFNDSFTVELTVSSENRKRQLTGEVAFFLSESFSKQIVFERVLNGSARITVTSSQAFTVGAYTSSGSTKLELDLNDAKGFPALFYTRALSSDQGDAEFSIPGITSIDLENWTNATQSFVQKIGGYFQIRNPNTNSLINDYNATTTAIQQFLAEAVKKQKSVRTIGSGWSSSKVAATSGWLLATRALNFKFTIAGSSVSTAYRGEPAALLFAQCGSTVSEINNILEGNKRALKTCTSSTGQTIAGLISTGSHGSAIDFGAMQDFVVGLHIVISPERHVYLERSTYPVVSDQFIHQLNTEFLRDDELFNAALVSFGAFGVIHGVMIETEELFLLEAYREKLEMGKQGLGAIAAEDALDFKFHFVQKDESQRKIWTLSLLNKEQEVLIVPDDFIFYRDMIARVKDIKESAMDHSNYRIETNLDGAYILKITGHDQILAESRRSFRTKDEVDELAESLFQFFSNESNASNDPIEKLVTTLNFSGLTFLPYPNQRPYLFQVFLQPGKSPAEIILTTMFKRGYNAAHSDPEISAEVTGPGDDINVLVTRSGSGTEISRSELNTLMNDRFPSYKNLVKTPARMFSNNVAKSGLLSTAIAVPLTRITEFNQILFGIFAPGNYSDAVFTYRYVKASPALLAFTRFQPTCIFEIDSIAGNIIKIFFEQILPALDEMGIPYTFHWGKLNNLDSQKIRTMYGVAADRWITARNRLLPASSINLFNNETLKDWGLDTTEIA